MADKKPAAGPEDNGLFWGVIGFMFIVFLIGYYVDRYTAQIDSQNRELGVDTSQEVRILPVGDLEVGKKVANVGEVQVRQFPGGPIIGTQAKRAVGKILEGPVDAFNQKWFRIDYQEIPDGWVSAKDLTTKVGLLTAVNIFPILFSIFKPIGILLAIILLIFIFSIQRKNHKTEQFIKNKKELELSAFKRKMEKTYEENSEPVNLASLGLPSNLPTGDASDLGFSFAVQEDTPTGPKNERWERVMSLMNSTSASDWRQAVIEADIILDDMLTRMGHDGESIGDKLKGIEESDFITLNKAWEAHKIRNHIAHRGGDFLFSKNEADRVINLYRQVFEEFYYI